MTGKSRAGRVDSLEGGRRKDDFLLFFVLEEHDENQNRAGFFFLSCFKAAVCEFSSYFSEVLESHTYKIWVEQVKSFPFMHILGYISTPVMLILYFMQFLTFKG